jgi:hypothetical protein
MHGPTCMFLGRSNTFLAPGTAGGRLLHGGAAGRSRASDRVAQQRWAPLPRARSHYRFARPTNPLYTRTTNIFGSSVSETTMRPNPTAASWRGFGWSGRALVLLSIRGSYPGAARASAVWLNPNRAPPCQACERWGRYSTLRARSWCARLQSCNEFENCTGLAQIVGQLWGPNRDFQSKCWAKSRNLGQSCTIFVSVGYDRL